MSAKFTAGPWAWWDESSGRPAKYDLCKLLPKEGGVSIFTTYGGAGFEALGRTGEEVANAHLIAAAPDLYAALEAVVADLYPWMPHKDVGETAYNAAVAALAKARGEV
jgi:hypothetical protein